MPALRSYQQEAVDFLTERQRAILAYPPGTGKTATIARWLLEVPGCRMLVVAPKGVLPHWVGELNAWAGFVAELGGGTASQRARARSQVADIGGILVINYEAMRQDIDSLVRIRWDAVIFDESHHLKEHSKQTFAAAAKLARRAPALGLATGTPLMNSADELWTSLHMLNPKLHSSFWRWAGLLFEITEVMRGYRKKASPGKKRGSKIISREVGDMKPGAAAVIRQQLAPYLMQRPLAELLPDLPPVTETYFVVELSKPEREMYDTMLRKKWLEYDGTVTVADAAITQSLRLRQLASDWTAFAGQENLGAKGQAALGLIEDLDGEQVLVLTAFRHTADILVKHLGDCAVTYHGGLADSDRLAALDRFRQGQVQVLVGTIATLGEGIDGLQVARHLIMLDRDWTPARNEQAIGRLRRSGQQSAVNVMHLVADSTIDQLVSEALKRKQSVVKAIMGQPMLGELACRTSNRPTGKTSNRTAPGRR